MASKIAHRFAEMVRNKQSAICQSLSDCDGTEFAEDHWQREGGGGGWSRILQYGNVFEKAGVNVSVVHGTMPAEAVQSTGGGHRVSLKKGEAIPFYAAGISIVIHPMSPMVPTAHANYRYFELGDASNVKAWWFGGGADLTPYYLFEEDVVDYHREYKRVCDQFDTSYYPRFKKWCDEYFHLAHRGEGRGVGGIFFDDLTGDEEKLFDYATACADVFIPAYLPIVLRRKDMPYGDAEQRWQQIRRGRYVEFNLVYDRGTTFGLRSGGRVESVLMSLPAVVRWEYDWKIAENSREAALVEVLQHPRNWLEKNG